MMVKNNSNEIQDKKRAFNIYLYNAKGKTIYKTTYWYFGETFKLQPGGGMTTAAGIGDLPLEDIADILVVEKFVLRDLFTSIANSIRNKKGTTEQIRAADFPTEIDNLKISSCNALLYDEHSSRFSVINWISEISAKDIDMSRVTSLSYGFDGCTNLVNLDLSCWNTSNINDMYRAFRGCYALENLNLSNFDTSKVTTMGEMFNGCSALTSLDLSSFNTAKVTTMYQMFCTCSKLVSVDMRNFNTGNVTNMRYMFYGCLALENLDLSNFDTSNVTEIDNMFASCYALQSISAFNGDSLDNIEDAFENCNKLTEFNGIINLGKAYTRTTANYADYILDLSYCTLLSTDSLINIINNLYDLNLSYDVANGGTLYTQSLILGTANLEKLTAEQIAIATNKRMDCYLMEVLRKIDLLEIKDWIIAIASLVTAIGIICGFIKSCLEKLTKPIIDKIDKMDKNQCMNYLTEFLADVKNGVHKNQYQIARAHDVYQHYSEDLHGNSYIHEQWELYMKERN